MKMYLFTHQFKKGTFYKVIVMISSYRDGGCPFPSFDVPSSQRSRFNPPLLHPQHNSLFNDGILESYSSLSPNLDY